MRGLKVRRRGASALPSHRPTPQQKIGFVNKKLGNKGIDEQQGTTRILYHYIPLDGRTQFDFFRDSQAVQFPLTNVGSFGNKLEVGETLDVERLHLSVITFDPVVTDEITAVLDLTAAGVDGIYRSDLNLVIANSQVMKPINVVSFKPEFNYMSRNDDNTVFWAYTDLIIPPLVEFEFLLRTPGYGGAVANAFLGLTVEGVGSILSPRHNL